MHAPTAGGTKAPMVHDRVKLPPAKERLRNMRGNAYDGDARNILNQKKKDGAAHVYHARCGGRYDNKDDTYADVGTFVGNFQGTYVCPGNSWDLRGCRQQPDEPL